MRKIHPHDDISSPQLKDITIMKIYQYVKIYQYDEFIIKKKNYLHGQKEK